MLRGSRRVHAERLRKELLVFFAGEAELSDVGLMDLGTRVAVGYKLGYRSAAGR
jgi:hypothetical protein